MSTGTAIRPIADSDAAVTGVLSRKQWAEEYLYKIKPSSAPAPHPNIPALRTVTAAIGIVAPAPSPTDVHNQTLTCRIILIRIRRATTVVGMDLKPLFIFFLIIPFL
jgi:hypothetical protein